MEDSCMFLYVVLTAIAGAVLGILLAARTKKAEDVVYGKLDKVGKITNIILIPAYVFVAPFCMFVGMICYPNHDGFLGILGFIVSIIIASATFFCGAGLGASVALRKKGKRKLGFAAQFAGVVGIGIGFVLFCLFYGNLLATLN